MTQTAPARSKKSKLSCFEYARSEPGFGVCSKNAAEIRYRFYIWSTNMRSPSGHGYGRVGFCIQQKHYREPPIASAVGGIWVSSECKNLLIKNCHDMALESSFGVPGPEPGPENSQFPSGNWPLQSRPASSMARPPSPPPITTGCQ
jgi:hypothetical protein